MSSSELLIIGSAVLPYESIAGNVLKRTGLALYTLVSILPSIIYRLGQHELALLSRAWLVHNQQ